MDKWSNDQVTPYLDSNDNDDNQTKQKNNITIPSNNQLVIILTILSKNPSFQFFSNSKRSANNKLIII